MAASADLRTAAIKPNYLTTHTDELALLGGTRHARRIFASPALAQHSSGEIQPAGHHERRRPAGLRRRAGNTLYHPSALQMGEDHAPGRFAAARARHPGCGDRASVMRPDHRHTNAPRS